MLYKAFIDYNRLLIYIILYIMGCNIIDHLRKPKVAGMAIFDLVGTFLVAVLIGYLMKDLIK